MRATGLFFIPTSSPDLSPAQDLIYKLSSTFEPTQLSEWALTHRLFRETSSSAQAASNLDGLEKQRITTQRFLQVLSLSHHAPKTYVAITAAQVPPQTRVGATPTSQQNGETARPAQPATIISIPAGSTGERFSQLIATKFGPLWQPRQVLHVSHGATFEVGDFRVRIGELKQGYGAGTQMPRGAVCEIEWIDAENAQQSDREAKVHESHPQNADLIIKEFWDSLGVKGAREIYSAPGPGDEMSTVRQWCEILRLRSQ